MTTPLTPPPGCVLEPEKYEYFYGSEKDTEKPKGPGYDFYDESGSGWHPAFSWIGFAQLRFYRRRKQPLNTASAQTAEKSGEEFAKTQQVNAEERKVMPVPQVPNKGELTSPEISPEKVRASVPVEELRKLAQVLIDCSSTSYTLPESFAYKQAYFKLQTLIETYERK